jgi:hypothetical protein
MAIVMEELLRKIPNDYQYKCSYLDHHSNDIKVLILGSSHAYYGLNPELMKYKSFNAAYVGQSLYYDWQIIQKYDHNWHHLKFIVLPVDYFSLYGKIENSVESWRVKDYQIYYGINSSRYTDHSEMLSNKLLLNISRIKSAYFNHAPAVLCSKLGWGAEYTLQKRKDLQSTGKLAAQRHLLIQQGCFGENAAILGAIIKYAMQNHVKVLLYTSPAYKSYIQNLNARQLNSTLNMLNSVRKQYSNVFYYNLLREHSFAQTDFYDADHLDNVGAKKLTHEIDSLLLNIEKRPDDAITTDLVTATVR